MKTKKEIIKIINKESTLSGGAYYTIYDISRAIDLSKENNTKGSFMWAVEQMKQGKKVRLRDGWGSDKEVYMFEDKCEGTMEYNPIFGTENNIKPAAFIIENFEATDWEVFEDNKEDELIYGCGERKIIDIGDPKYMIECGRNWFCEKCISALNEALEIRKD